MSKLESSIPLPPPVLIEVESIRKNPDNPRVIKDEKFRKLVKSLKEFPEMMQLRPIVVNKKMIILGGNMRFEAAIQAGWTQVPVIISDLTESQEREFVIKDNLAFGEWDWNMLGNQYDHETLTNWGLDVPQVHRKRAEEDNFDTIQPNKPITKPGDVYELNGHRLGCGDCRDGAFMNKLMDGKLADMIFTDPPYNVNYEGKGKKTKTKIKNDSMPEELFRGLLQDAFTIAHKYSADHAPLYTCYAFRTHREFEDSLNMASWQVRSQIIWVKALAAFGWGDYRWKHEPILYCSKDGKSINFYGDRRQYTEWDEEPTDEELLKKVRAMIKKDEEGNSTVWRFTRDSNYEHPTQKPILLVGKAITNSSREGEYVLDLFNGSGTTLIASEQLGRLYMGLDLDPRWIDVTVNRWIKWKTDNNERFEVKKNGHALIFK